MKKKKNEVKEKRKRGKMGRKKKREKTFDVWKD